MKLYKLTDENGFTQKGQSNETLWGTGTTHSAKGTDGLCSDGVIHAYENPFVAAFMNPVHADFKNPILWEAEGKVVARQGQLKCGCKKLTTVRQIPLPEISTEQRIEISIRCAMVVCKDDKWINWAEKWLSGEDRSQESATAAANDAYYAINTYVAVNATTAAAASANAAYVATTAAYVATVANAADAADLIGIIEKVLDTK